jgi:hypothetical protein
MRLVCVTLVMSFALVVGARSAGACGVWRMVDSEKHFVIRWLVNSATITAKADRGAYRRIGGLYLDTAPTTGMRAVWNKKVLFDLRAGQLLRYGKAVGRVDESGTITIGKRVFTVTFGDEKQLHDMPAWPLTVKRGDTVVLASEEASALCAFAEAKSRGKQLTTAEQQAEIVRRVAFYLLWRELGT